MPVRSTVMGHCSAQIMARKCVAVRSAFQKNHEYAYIARRYSGYSARFGECFGIYPFEFLSCFYRELVYFGIIEASFYFYVFNTQNLIGKFAFAFDISFIFYFYLSFSIVIFPSFPFLNSSNIILEVFSSSIFPLKNNTSPFSSYLLHYFIYV